MGQRSSKPKNSYNVAPVADKPQQSATPASIEIDDTKTKSKVVPAAPIEAAKATPAPTPQIVNNELVPKWINESLFVEILKENEPEFSKIQSFRLKPALGAGENYATLMLRVSIEVELTDKSIKPVSYMLKVPHDSPEMEQMLQVANFFTVENEAYMNFVPKLEELYKSKGLDITIAPRAYQFKESLKQEPKLANTVLMYDLGQDGYKNVNRVDCLNLEQSKLVLRKMAQYHAASAHYKSVHGPYPDILLYGMFGSDIEKAMAMMEAMMGPTQKLFLNNLKNYKDCEKYHDKLELFFSKFRDMFLTAKPDPNEFNVINHGDSWVNNLLFNIGHNGELIDMLFVDFQNPRYGHPSADLLYFIMTSVHIDHKLKDFDYLIKYYHDQLIEHLQLLGYTERMPKLREFQMEMYKYGSWAVTASFLVLPLVLLDPTESATFENFLGNSEGGNDFKNLMYTNKRYQMYIEQILPWLDNRGLLEAYEPTQGQGAIQSPVATQIQVNIAKSAETEVDSSVPEWVNSDYFKDLLEAEHADFKEIQKFCVKKATEAGDNYASIMLSVDIDYQTTSDQSSNVAYMLKVPPNGSASKAILDLMLTYKKELAMYEDVIPQLEEIYQQAGQTIIFSPKSYKLKNAPDCEHLLLQNLRTAGYKNADRLQGLSQTETEHVLTKLAKLHAASAQLYVTKGAYADCLDKPLHTEATRAIYESPETKSFYDTFNESVKTYKGNELFADKLAYYMDHSFDLTAQAQQYDKNQFNCINHGDCWTNNVMFAYDAQGQIKDTLLIDYQRSCFGTPALDLYYFLLSSPSFDIKIAKFDYFVRYYHGELQRNLELLKYPRHIPTLKELHTTLLNNPLWAVSTVSSVMSAVLLDPTDNASIETMMGTDAEAKEFKKKLFQNDRYRKHAEALYPWLNHRGLLDFE